MLRALHQNRSNVVRRFLRFFVVGFLTLLGELALTAFLLYTLGIPAIPAIGLGFFISLVLSYFLFRKYAFHGTKRKHASGFTYFCIIAVMGVSVSMAGAELAINFLGIHPLVARFLVAGVTGVLNFLINLVYNFKVVDVH